MYRYHAPVFRNEVVQGILEVYLVYKVPDFLIYKLMTAVKPET